MLPQHILERISLLDVVTYRHTLAIPSIARFSQLKQLWLQKYFTQIYHSKDGREQYIYFIINKDIPHRAKGEGPAIITQEQTKIWYQNGKIHRDDDKPAKKFAKGTKMWYQNGKIHRDNDKPAIIYGYGTKMWYQNDKIHRDNDKPAIIYDYGTKTRHQNGKPAMIDTSKQWRKNGILHRDGDKPAIEWANGRKEWYKNGQLHRDNGPAKWSSNDVCWCKNGLLHREDGPAVIFKDGREEWWINGIKIKVVCNDHK